MEELLTNPEAVEAADDGQEQVVAAQEGGEQTEPQSEGEAQEVPGNADRAEGRRQTHEDNAAARAARRRAEQETAQRMQREYTQRLSGSGLVNPRTGRPFADFEELEHYGRQLQEERLAAEAKRTGRPVEELREEEEDRVYLRQKRKADSEAELQEQKLREKREFLVQDAKQFAQAYPDVDIVKLEADPKFQKFAKRRLYVEPLSEIYADYLDVVGGAAQAAQAKAQSKAARSTGAGSGSAGGGLTSAQKAELEAWNRKFPEYHMSEKEFLKM